MEQNKSSIFDVFYRMKAAHRFRSEIMADLILNHGYNPLKEYNLMKVASTIVVGVISAAVIKKPLLVRAIYSFGLSSSCFLYCTFILEQQKFESLLWNEDILGEYLRQLHLSSTSSGSLPPSSLSALLASQSRSFTSTYPSASVPK